MFSCNIFLLLACSPDCRSCFISVWWQYFSFIVLGLCLTWKLLHDRDVLHFALLLGSSPLVLVSSSSICWWLWSITANNYAQCYTQIYTMLYCVVCLLWLYSLMTLQTWIEQRLCQHQHQQHQTQSHHARDLYRHCIPCRDHQKVFHHINIKHTVAIGVV